MYRKPLHVTTVIKHSEERLHLVCSNLTGYICQEKAFLVSVGTLDHVCIQLSVTQDDQMATGMVHSEHLGERRRYTGYRRFGNDYDRS